MVPEYLSTRVPEYNYILKYVSRQPDTSGRLKVFLETGSLTSKPVRLHTYIHMYIGSLHVSKDNSQVMRPSPMDCAYKPNVEISAWYSAQLELW